MRYLAAVAALAVLTVLPGPDVALVTRVALGEGVAAARRAALGIVTGLAVWGGLTAAGLAAVLARSARAYDVVRVAGAAYLVVLGVQALLRSRRVDDRGAGADGTEDRRPVRRPYRAGLLSNLLNPKIAAFYTSVLPQLVPAGAPATATMVGLVATHVVLSIAWLVAYARLLHGAAARLRSPRVRARLEALSGAVLVAFGLRLALDRP